MNSDVGPEADRTLTESRRIRNMQPTRTVSLSSSSLVPHTALSLPLPG